MLEYVKFPNVGFGNFCKISTPVSNEQEGIFHTIFPPRKQFIASIWLWTTGPENPVFTISLHSHFPFLVSTANVTGLTAYPVPPMLNFIWLIIIFQWDSGCKPFNAWFGLQFTHGHPPTQKRLRLLEQEQARASSHLGYSCFCGCSGSTIHPSSF